MKYKGFTYTPTPKTAWYNLSILEKSEMMKVAVRNGITDLRTIREKYNEFAEGGSKEEVVNTDRQYFRTMEKVADENYQKWGFSNPDEALLHALNDNTYDYRGYYNKYPQSQANADTHWTDEFKTAYHSTFSRESVYSGRKSQYNPLGLTGGFWSEETFVPMAWQLYANEYKKGGGIHIKPSHRGRLTELKKRTGKTEAELYRTGSPATRKMITFACNARKWKHGLGGNLFNGTSEDTQQMQVARPDATYVAKPVIPPTLPSITLPIENTSSIVTSNPGYYFVRNIVGKTFGLPPTTYNAQDLTKEQLAEIDRQVRHRSEQKGITDAYFRFHPNDTIHIGIDAKTLYPEMYDRSYGNTDMQVKFRTPSGQVETILGDYPVKIFKNGYEINDVYDFNIGQGLYPGNESLYASIRRWAGEHGSKNTDNDKNKLKFNIKRNLTHW